MPSYLLRTVGPSDQINLDDVIEESKEEGDGGDSDSEADDLLDDALVDALLERQTVLVEDEDTVEDGDRNSVLLTLARKILPSSGPTPELFNIITTSTMEAPGTTRLETPSTSEMVSAKAQKKAWLRAAQTLTFSEMASTMASQWLIGSRWCL